MRQVLFFWLEYDFGDNELSEIVFDVRSRILKLRKSDFVITENYHMRLKEATAKILIEKISLNFNRTTYYKAKKHSCQNILLDNVQQLANYIIGKRKDLQQIPLMKVPRTDLLELQQKNFDHVSV